MKTSLTLPKRVEAEKGLIAILLQNPEKIVEVIDRLEPEDFYELPTQQIWRILKSLHYKGVEIDMLSVKDEAKKMEMDSQAILSEVAESYEQFVSTNNLERHINEITNASLLRDLVGFGYKYQKEAQEEEKDAKDLMVDMEGDLLKIADRTMDARPINVKGILKEIEEDVARGEHFNWAGYDSGFKVLDDRTGGLIPTHVWIVGAYTGVGKTFFVLQMVLNLLKQGAGVVLFSTEMDRKMNLIRLMGNLSNLSTINILKKHLTDSEEDNLEKARKKLRKYNKQLFIYDSIYSVEEIRLKLKRLTTRKKVNVVFIDFIQNLKGSENIYERMSNAAIELQRIAQELGLTIVIASQVSQAEAGWKKSEAIGYKGAGEIAAIADVGLWISPHKEFQDLRWLHMRKVRHGSPAKCTIRVSFPSGRVTQASDAEEKPNDGGGDLADEQIEI